MPIEGDGEANTLEGTNGDDVINAYGGDDTIYASMGDDVIDGGDGLGDWLIVGARNPDRFPQAGAQTYVITAGTVTSSSGSMNTSFSGIEILSFNNSGTSFGDTIDAKGEVMPEGYLTVDGADSPSPQRGRGSGPRPPAGASQNVPEPSRTRRGCQPVSCWKARVSET